MEDSAVGCGVGVGGLVFDGGAVEEQEAAVAVEGVAGAVEDAGEVIGPIAVEVVADGFGVELEICRIVEVGS